MKQKNKKFQEGWQCFVEIEGDYVIKKIKTKEEVSKKIKEYLIFKNSLESLEERTEKIYSDIHNSLKIISSSKIPKKLLANAIIEKEIIKQDRVTILEDKIKELLIKNKIKESKKLIGNLVDFIIELWKYKIHEKTYKFYSNYGLDKRGKIVLVDFLEITNDKEKVEKQIINKKWDKPSKYFKKVDESIINYFIKLANKKLTLKDLEKNWGKYA